jgi:type IV secretion system protein VirD4
MVSRQETARPLLTPGEVMQLPPSDELVLVAGIPPLRARKARYYEDRRLTARILDPPALASPSAASSGGRNVQTADNWTLLSAPDTATAEVSAAGSLIDHDQANSGIRREPALPDHEEIVPETPKHETELWLLDDEPDDDSIRAKAMSQNLRAVARQAALDPDDGLGM